MSHTSPAIVKIFLLHCNYESLCEKCPYLGFFWSVFSRIWTEYKKILSISPYSVRMRENMDQNDSKYGHFSRIVWDRHMTFKNLGTPSKFDPYDLKMISAEFYALIIICKI